MLEVIREVVNVNGYDYVKDNKEVKGLNITSLSTELDVIHSEELKRGKDVFTDFTKEINMKNFFDVVPAYYRMTYTLNPTKSGVKLVLQEATLLPDAEFNELVKAKEKKFPVAK